MKLVTFDPFRRAPQTSGLRVRILTAILAAAIVPAALAIRARAEPRQVSAGRFSATAASQPPERSIVGTLDSVDAKTMQFVVSSPAGKQTLHLQTGATIRQGPKTVKASELSAHKGERVKVRYRETAGVQQAEWIVFASPPPPRKSKHSEADTASHPPASAPR